MRRCLGVVCVRVFPPWGVSRRTGCIRPRVVTRPRVGGFLCDVLGGVVLYPQCYLMYNLVTENRATSY